jgi:hypothetical protein
VALLKASEGKKMHVLPLSNVVSVGCNVEIIKEYNSFNF